VSPTLPTLVDNLSNADSLLYKNSRIQFIYSIGVAREDARVHLHPSGREEGGPLGGEGKVGEG